MKSIVVNIDDRNSDSTLNIALDTLLLKKQCIVFVNTKKSAETAAYINLYRHRGNRDYVSRFFV